MGYSTIVVNFVLDFHVEITFFCKGFDFLIFDIDQSGVALVAIECRIAFVVQ